MIQAPSDFSSWFSKVLSRTIATGLFAMMLFGSIQGVKGQVYVGLNVAPALGRTVDLNLFLFPKNQDWLTLHLAGGYTFAGPLFVPSRATDCVKNVRNSGWNVRAGARNNFTRDHHDNHLYWGMDLVYSRQNETATINTCEDPSVQSEASFNYNMMSAAFNAGYSWNPLAKKTIYNVIKVDFGGQVGFPLWSSQTFPGERHYVSGLGYTWLPFRSVAFQGVAIFRWEMTKRRFGYSKPKGIKFKGL